MNTEEEKLYFEIYWTNFIFMIENWHLKIYILKNCMYTHLI